MILALDTATLQAGVAYNAFSNDSAAVLANAAGVTLALKGYDQGIGSLAGGGTTGGTVNLAGATLTTGYDNTSTTFAGTITGTSISVRGSTADVTSLAPTITITGAQVSPASGVPGRPQSKAYMT